MKTDYEDTKETVSDRLERGFLYGDARGPDAVPGGKVTEVIETQMGKLPWVSWLGLSVASMAASATIASTTRKGDRNFASFVGLWAPCFMLMGVYSKLVQIEKSMNTLRGLPESRAEVPTSTSYLS